MLRLRAFVWTAGLLLIGFPATSDAQLILYDDFNAKTINPEKWHGVEASGGQALAPNTEVRRRIVAHHLELQLTSYGETSSDSRTATAGNNRLRVNDANSITAIQADVAVTESERQDCPGNRTPTRTRAMLNGAFFNDGTSTGANDRTGDVVARIDKQGDSAGNIIAAVIGRCDDPACDTATTLNFHIFAKNWRVGNTDTLRLEWDNNNHQFHVAINPGTAGEESAILPYSVSDISAPAFPFKELRVQNQVANCLSERMTGSITARFDSVMVNP